MSSTIGNPGATAGFALIAAAIAGSAVVVGIVHRRIEAVLAAAIIVLMLAVVMLTGARGPLLMLPVPALAIGVLAWTCHREAVRRQMRSIAVASVAAGLILVVALAITPAGGRLLALVRGGDLSTSERSLIYAATLEAVARRPVLGVGMDGLIVVYPSVRPAGISTISGPSQTQNSTHSWFLHQLLGAGILGLAAATSFVGSIVWIGWRAVREGNAAAGIGLAGIAAFLAQGAFNIVHIASDTFFWLSAGLVATQVRVGADGPHPVRAAPRRRDRGSISVVVALLAGALAAMTVTGALEANRAIRSSNAARQAGDVTAAQRLAVRATEADPGRADTWNVLGLAFAARPTEAAPAFARAVRAAPYEPVYLLNLAREGALLGQKDQQARVRSADDARKAIALDPNGPTTLIRAAEILLFNGSAQESLAHSTRAIALSPRTATAYDLASRAHEALGNYDTAADLYRQMIEIHIPVKAAAVEQRSRLAHLYARSGRADLVRSLIAPPKVDFADTSCTPTNGSARVGGEQRPRCFRITFAVEEPLQAEASAVGSAIRAANYMVGGRPLAEGTRLTYDNARFVVVQLPADAAPPPRGSLLTVRGLVDRLGLPLQPDPSTVDIQ